jgi:hypothetical protein
MAYQMTITLTDEEYAALSEEAARAGKPLETLLHETIAPHLPKSQVSRPMSDADFTAYLYRKGIIMNIPTNESDTPEEVAEIEQIARKISTGQSLSEMVIEDRGPKE